MVYTQITKNAPMDLKNAMFIAHTFRVSPYVVRDVYNRHYLDTKRLTRAQFVHVMREAMNKSGVSGGGLTDRSRDLHRSFSISDAPVDSPRPPATDRPVMATKRLAVDSVRDGYRERGDARNKLADSIRSLESTILVRKTQRGSPLTPSMTSRFVDGSITARRVPTACYLPSRRNLTLVAKRPTTTDARAANVRGNGGNIMGFFGKTPFARDSYGESPGHIWGTRMEAESAQRQKSASVNGMRPRTAAEMGRTAKCDRDMTKMGRTAKCDLDMTQVTDGEDTQQQAREFVDYLSAGLRKRNAQRADLLMLFEHFDQNKTEHVSLEHARLVFAELDCILSLSALREVAMVANALGQDESVNYKKLSDALIPLFSGSKSTSTRNPALDKKIVRKSPQALHKALAHLAFLAWNHRHEIFRQTSGRQNERVQKTFAEQVRALDHNDDGTCQLPDLKIVLMGMGLSPGEIDTISDYLVAESNKTGQRGGQQSVVYPLLLRMIHTEMTMRDKIAGWDSCPVFPAGPARKIMPKQTSILDITEPSERRRTGLAAVYKKVNAEVRSTAKLCTIFENLDPANEGVVSLDAFHLALGKLCVRLSEDETQILMEQLDPKKSGRVDYSKFIALMLPAEMLKEDALGYTSVIRKGKNCGPGSLEASINAMANLSSDEILTILRNGCVRALAEGPQSLKQEYSIFKIPHDARISSRNISRFVQDFGLHLSDHQCQALFNKIDSKNDGFVNYYDFMKKVLPPDASIQEGAAKR
jgi:Ca2+-binding EF-hand superfamily protein